MQEIYLNKSVGSGQCVALVQEAAKAPLTISWKQGEEVAGKIGIQKGTVIATFQNGRYGNRMDGQSHAALYLRQDVIGIWVVDQWKNSHSHQPAHIRQIKFKQGHGKPNDDGNAYYVVE